MQLITPGAGASVCEISLVTASGRRHRAISGGAGEEVQVGRCQEK